MAQNKAVVNYWAKHYISYANGSSVGHCSLCGNGGIIDTRKAKTPAGIRAGRKNFCICPNGQAARERFESILPKDGSLSVHNTKRVKIKE